MQIDVLHTGTAVARLCRPSQLDEAGRPQAAAFQVRVEDGQPLEQTLSVYWLDYLCGSLSDDRRCQVDAVRSYLRDGSTGFKEMNPGASWSFAVLETDRLAGQHAPAGAIEFRASPRSDHSICLRLDGGIELRSGAPMCAEGLVDPHASVHAIPHSAPLEWAVCHFLAERVMSSWESVGPKKQPSQHQAAA